MQKISWIGQSVLELSHCENGHNDNNDNDDDTHPGWIIGKYSVADYNSTRVGVVVDVVVVVVVVAIFTMG